MSIRAERHADHEAVDAVHRAAFGERGASVVSLLTDLRAVSGAVSLVAERYGAVVGHVMFSPGWLDAPRRLAQAAVLSPVAVLPRHQRRGIGSTLIRHGLRVLDDQGVPVVLLKGPSQYDGRLGFRPRARQASQAVASHSR